MLERLRELNPNLQLFNVDSKEFTFYGHQLKGHNFAPMFSDALKAMEKDGPTYFKDIESLHKTPSFTYLKDTVFGEIEIQTGICFGNNTLLNGMEWHKSSEVIISVTDVVLMLGKHTDIVNDSWNSSLTQCFYLPKGTAVELYAGTLHLAPCRTSETPFCTIIVLPTGTNSPLKNSTTDNTLFMQNKWLICHNDSPAVKRGAYVGINGDNLDFIV
ncbi:MAG: DUF4867 family protein [Spirochaetaceae bacterium]